MNSKSTHEILTMNNIKMQARSILVRGVDIILPPRCPVSGDIVDAQGMIASGVWADIDFISDPICPCCGIPVGFGVDEDGKCMACFDNPPIYSSARSALKYNDASRNLILGFKHGDKTHIVSSFVPWLMRTGVDIINEADYLIPVPLHHKRLISRRYNQAALIAGELSNSTNVPHLPMAMKRVRSTPSQGCLSQDDRRKNVSQAFDVAEKHKSDLGGKVIILVDDVYTTGATVNECARILLKYGAKKVHVLTLARVVNEG